MSRRPEKPAPVVVKRPAEQRRKLPPELEAFARSDEEKLRIRRPYVDRGKIKDPREGYTVAGVANRDARAVYDVRAEAMRALWADGSADEQALDELGQLLHDALRLELWHARRITSFDVFVEEVVGMPAERARGLIEASSMRTREPMAPLTQREIALWLRTEAGLYEGDEAARARIRTGAHGPVLEISVDLAEASTALAGVGARHLPLARGPRELEQREPSRERELPSRSRHPEPAEEPEPSHEADEDLSFAEDELPLGEPDAEPSPAAEALLDAADEADPADQADEQPESEEAAQPRASERAIQPAPAQGARLLTRKRPHEGEAQPRGDHWGSREPAADRHPRRDERTHPSERGGFDREGRGPQARGGFDREGRGPQARGGFDRESRGPQARGGFDRGARAEQGGARGDRPSFGRAAREGQGGGSKFGAGAGNKFGGNKFGGNKFGGNKFGAGGGNKFGAGGGKFGKPRDAGGFGARKPLTGQRAPAAGQTHGGKRPHKDDEFED